MKLVINNIRTIEDQQTIAKMPQTVKIRNHLIRYGSITSQEAWRLYNITRLSDVVYKLKYKKEPRMDIKTEMVYERDRFGNPIQYAKYYI